MSWDNQVERGQSFSMQSFPEKCQLTFLTPPDASLLGEEGAVRVETAVEGNSALFL